MMINETNGEYVGTEQALYLRRGPDGLECRERAPLPPHYRCTRRKGHDGDHAAHGEEPGRMFARWRHATEQKEE